MIRDGGQRILMFFCGFVTLTAVGCADLDLPSWVPFQGPASDTLPGVVTPAEKIQGFKNLALKSQSCSPEEKKKISEELAFAIRSEQDPMIRREIIRTLAYYPGPAADAVVKAALDDPEAMVRATACESLGHRNDAETVKLLSEAIRDVDLDVRLSAAKALGKTHNSAAVPALGELLENSDPAIQYHAVLALQEATGRSDLGDDVGRWQAYVKGKEPEPAPTWAQRIQKML